MFLAPRPKNFLGAGERLVDNDGNIAVSTLYAYQKAFKSCLEHYQAQELTNVQNIPTANF